jgi:hypothetical protein
LLGCGELGGSAPMLKLIGLLALPPPRRLFVAKL